MRIINGRVFDLEQGFLSRDVLTDGGQIASASGDDRILDAAGCYVIPGLVDVHFHGCVGEDFSDATPDGLQKIADFELSQGVAYLCPAGMTLPEDQLTAICKNTAAHRAKHSGGAEVVGAHLEGPFLCMAKKGAQNGDYLHDPDTAMLKRLQAAAEPLERLVQRAPAVLHQLLTVELVGPVPGVHRHPAKGHHPHPVFRAEAQTGRLPPEHDAPQGPRLILQRKVVVPRGVAFIIGDLPPHQQSGEQLVPVHQPLHVAVHLGHGIDGQIGKPHPGIPRSNARWARMATPRALSVAYWGWANTAPQACSRAARI